jgi:uncharacterized membrane protein YgcG
LRHGASLHEGSSVRGVGVAASSSQTQRRLASDTNLRLTVMLLSVSLTFLLTTLPMNASLIASAFWNREAAGDVSKMVRLQLVFTISELLMYTNHSVNFFLYCATGQKFRSEIVRMVCGMQRQNPILSDHSQHLYCSRNCGGDGNARGAVSVGGGSGGSGGGGGGGSNLNVTTASNVISTTYNDGRNSAETEL